MKPPLGMLAHTNKVMPILSSVLVLIGFSDLVCRDQPQGHPSGPSAPSGCPLGWSLHTRWENPIQTRLPQVLLHCRRQGQGGRGLLYSASVMVMVAGWVNRSQMKGANGSDVYENIGVEDQAFDLMPPMMAKKQINANQTNKMRREIPVIA